MVIIVLPLCSFNLLLSMSHIVYYFVLYFTHMLKFYYYYYYRGFFVSLFLALCVCVCVCVCVLFLLLLSPTPTHPHLQSIKKKYILFLTLKMGETQIYRVSCLADKFKFEFFIALSFTTYQHYTIYNINNNIHIYRVMYMMMVESD